MVIADFDEKVAFLKSLNQPRIDLGLKRDLSLDPQLFGRNLLVKGLYIWGRALSEKSLTLAQIECNVILYNETDREKVIVPEGYLLFRLHDLQEFPYLAAVRVREEE